ncbi:Ribonuclease H [Fusarium albosuccineum]|uniref:Ribonuclease H n=1 Tax=Fusarium albosuccineum TaxID=1237068 RepID=A0A8H4L0R4_9HYPO|nr:Ribonuclease H [Fusarium albosuccineum]
MVGYRTTSNPGSERTRMSRVSAAVRLATDDNWMPPPSVTNNDDFRFVTCSKPGCPSSSAYSEYNAITLRAGYDTCTNHTTVDDVVNRVRTTIKPVNSVFIFYDVEVTSNNEIDQLSATTTDGKHIDLVIKTMVRKNNSPLIGKLSPFVYMLVATEPVAALNAFVEWVKNTVRRMTDGAGTEDDVVLVAHNGMNHDHVLLLKTMLVWGISPPKWRFSDSLPIFKLVIDPENKATLDVLASKYAPWFQHTHHDGLSDAMAIRHIVTKGVTDWEIACLVFSSPCEYFVTSVGLNTFNIRPTLPHTDTINFQR